MFKKSNNPKIEELTKSVDNRSFNLSNLKAIEIVNINKQKEKFCAWCVEKQLHHHNQKYCSKECSHFAMAWAYPQKEEGLFFLLQRQQFKCNICQYDYFPLINKIHLRMYEKYGIDFKPGEKFDWGLIKRLKNRIEYTRKPEVDHITPIFKGGESLGLDNHQAICYTCHKEKTSKDLTKKK